MDKTVPFDGGPSAGGGGEDGWRVDMGVCGLLRPWAARVALPLPLPRLLKGLPWRLCNAGELAGGTEGAR